MPSGRSHEKIVSRDRPQPSVVFILGIAKQVRHIPTMEGAGNIWCVCVGASVFVYLECVFVYMCASSLRLLPVPGCSHSGLYLSLFSSPEERQVLEPGEAEGGKRLIYLKEILGTL